MKIAIFDNIKGGRGEICSYERFCEAVSSERVSRIISQLASGQLDDEGFRKAKASLPAVCWSAWFKEGVRKGENAVLNGLVALDFDHVEGDLRKFFSSRIEPLREQLGLVACHISPSGHGLRVVIRWNPQFQTIADNQAWAASLIGLPHDEACKDPGRLGFLSTAESVLFLDPDIFDPKVEAPEWFAAIRDSYGQTATAMAPAATEATGTTAIHVPADTQTHYKGVALQDIAAVLGDSSLGGRPRPGERNSRYFALANELKTITDFNPYAIFAALKEGCTLPEAELFAVCSNACKYRGKPVVSARLKKAVDMLAAAQKGEEELSEEEIINTDITFALPPIFKQWFEAAPADMKQAVLVSLLPCLAALGSKLRAKYLSNKLEEPLFQVVVCGQQSSGKGALEVLVNKTLKVMLEKDREGLAQVRAFEEEVKVAKMSGGRTKAERAELRDLFASRPKPILRYAASTISQTKLLQLMEQAQGTSLFQFSPEIDTIYKAFKRSCCDISVILRNAWDASTYSQAFASSESFTGMVTLRMCCLYSGTPAKVRRFYTDSEDGTMSRTLFYDLPDMTFKPMENFTPFTEAEERYLDEQLERLSRVTLVDDEVQEDHVMEMDWLNKRMERWLDAQLQLAIKTNDRTRATYRKRSAVQGFRAGMIAFYLFGEKNTYTVKKNVSAFAIWVANMALKGLMSRVRLEEDTDNAFFASVVYNVLPDTFTREELEKRLNEYNLSTPVKTVLSIWRSKSLISPDKAYGATCFTKAAKNQAGTAASTALLAEPVMPAEEETAAKADETAGGLAKADETAGGLAKADETAGGLAKADETAGGLAKADETAQGSSGGRAKLKS